MPTDDYIKRSDCIEAITKAEKWWWNADDLQEYRRIFESIPAAYVAEVRHGRWKGPRYRFGIDELECTMCGHLIKVRAGSELPNFCDYCGAKMMGEEDDDATK